MPLPDEKSNPGESKMNTFEPNIDAAVLELRSLQGFAERLVHMLHGRVRTATEWKIEITISFLSIAVGSYGVHPQHNLFAIFVLSREKNDGAVMIMTMMIY